LAPAEAAERCEVVGSRKPRRLKSAAGAADISRMRRPIASLLLSALLLTGCDQLGIETPALANARKEADSKAIGGACRHAGRAIEDCYTLNKKADKAAVYAGWREMNEYMRENKLEPVVPVIPPEPPKPPKPPKAAASKPAEGDEADEPADAPAHAAAKH
jgi:hypothetical protein